MARLVKAKAWDAAWSTLPPWAQEKIDGHRLIIQRGVGAHKDSVMGLTTSFIDIAYKLSAYDWWRNAAAALLPGEQMDGEMAIAGGTSEDVKTAIKKRDPCLEFSPFAWTRFPDDESLETVDVALRNCDLTPPSRVATRVHSIDTLLGYAKIRGWEGWILKDGNYKGWYKLKLEKTIDAVIVDVKPGKGKYAGMIGSFEVSVYAGDQLLTIGNVAGMLDHVRGMDPVDCVARIIEVKYQRVGRNGKLVLPRMLRWRNDKFMRECTVDQDPELRKVLT